MTNTAKIQFNDDGTIDIFSLDTDETLLTNENNTWGDDYKEAYIHIATVDTYRKLYSILRKFDPLK